MSVKVAINGFGRIGRLAFRQMFGAEGYEVVAINDLTKSQDACSSSQVRYRSGRLLRQDTVNLHEGRRRLITVDGKKITIYAMKERCRSSLGRRSALT